jgi:AraC-like DNA-binding protein
MANTGISPIELSDIREFAHGTISLGDEYILTRVKPGDFSPEDIINPWRFDGVAIILMLNASGKVTINHETFNLPRYSVLVIEEEVPVNLHYDDTTDMEAYVLFLSKSFLRSVNIDANAVGRTYSTSSSPVIKLSAADSELLQRYLDLVRDNTKTPSGSKFKVSIARNLIANIFYILLELDQRHNPDENANEDVSQRPRRINYTNEFMRLVREHHCRERSIGFYADKLFITPKYLSRIIKETTGKSAAQWISRHVIIEAKNMIRFSGKNIQQIAYELNFPNQSSFGKYFKHGTGMSPSEFQHS